jgi:hypothetical protein
MGRKDANNSLYDYSYNNNFNNSKCSGHMAMRWSKELKDEILRRRMALIGPTAIAKDLGLKLASVNSFLSLHDLPPITLRWTNEIVRQCKELRDKGWTYKRIARKVGSHPTIISRKLKERYE